MMHAGGLLMVMLGLLAIGFIVLVVLLIIRLAMGAGRSHIPGGTGYSSPSENLNNKALGILAERYAKGEIDDEEYKKKKEELSK